MTFGTYGGGDHYVITDADEVERLLTRDVAEVDQDRFRAELTAVAPYAKIPAIRARIHLAMLYLADGDIHELRRAREVADGDWRDLLAIAEYPSTPSIGTEETPSQKRARHQRDFDAITSWRNRPGPPDSPSATAS